MCTRYAHVNCCVIIQKCHHTRARTPTLLPQSVPLQTLPALPSLTWASLASRCASVPFPHPSSLSLAGCRSGIELIPVTVGPPPPSPLVIVVGSELRGTRSVAPTPQEAPRHPGGHSRCPPHRVVGGCRRVASDCVLRCSALPRWLAPRLVAVRSSPLTTGSGLHVPHGRLGLEAAVLIGF
jgi:hypothetical protein